MHSFSKTHKTALTCKLKFLGLRQGRLFYFSLIGPPSVVKDLNFHSAFWQNLSAFKMFISFV